MLARPSRSSRLRSLDPPHIVIVEATRGRRRPRRPPARRCRVSADPAGESYVWWRSVAGVVFAISLFALVTMVVSQALVMLFWATTAGNQPYRDYFAKAFAFETPLGMLAVNLGLATLIPIAWALMAFLHQMRPRWLSSVQPRTRWRYLFGCLAIAAVVLNGVMLLSTKVGEPLSLHPQKGFWGFLVVIVLSHPPGGAEESSSRYYPGRQSGSTGGRRSRLLAGVCLLPDT